MGLAWLRWTGFGALGLAAAWPLAAEPVARERVTAALVETTALAEKIVADGGVPGLAVVVVHDDETVLLQGFGLRQMGRPGTVDGDTVFQLASMSKPISSTVVAALVGDGLLTWDARIADLAPEYRLHDPYPTAEVTVRDLFNHRSGLPGNAGNDLEDIGFDRETVMRRLRLAPPSSSFRAGYAYSNAGLTLGALAAARPTGEDWETVAEERLFAPLGMAATSYRHADFLSRDDAAALHVPVDGVWTAGIERDATAQAPAGGASSSARDLAIWMRLQIGRGTLDGEERIKAAALEATHAPLMSRGPSAVEGDPSFYGLGWALEYTRHGPTWTHAGAFSVGARTLVTIWPEADLGIVVLTNAFPTGAPEAIADGFADLVFDGRVAKDYLTLWNAAYESLFGPAVAASEATYGAPPADAADAAPSAAYVGTYRNDYVGDAQVVEEGGGLVLVVGPNGARRYPLTHFNRDLFLYYPSPETPTVASPLSFAMGADGRARGLTADSLDGEGLGTLTRDGS